MSKPHRGDKVDKAPELWYSAPKVHMSVFKDVCTRMLSTWTFQDIYDEVAKSDIQDDDDIIVTTRAIALIRDRRREALKPR